MTDYSRPAISQGFGLWVKAAWMKSRDIGLLEGAGDLVSWLSVGL